MHGFSVINCFSKDAKDTSVVYLQSSPMSQPSWQVADDSSAPSSVSATPTFMRKRSMRNNKPRPASLSVETVSPPLSPNFNDLKMNRKLDTSPQVIITPVSSLEKLHRLKDRLLKSSEAILSQGGGNGVYDDENVPLVLEILENTSSETSPMSGPVSAERTDSRSSGMSVGNILDRSKSFESITSRSHFDRFSVDDFDMQIRSKQVRSPPLVRQHEIRPDSSLALEWDGPETSV